MSEFKVGDWAVWLGTKGTKKLLLIEKVSPKLGYPQRVKVDHWGGIRVSRHEIRHATPEEIKAGRRLP